MAGLSGPPNCRDELKRFYQEPGPDDPSELEQATEDVCCWADEDAAQWEELDWPIPPSRADEAQTWNSPGVQLPDYEDTLDSQTKPAPSASPDWPHKFEPGPDWTKITESWMSPGTPEVHNSVLPLLILWIKSWGKTRLMMCWGITFRKPRLRPKVQLRTCSGPTRNLPWE